MLGLLILLFSDLMIWYDIRKYKLRRWKKVIWWYDDHQYEGMRTVTPCQDHQPYSGTNHQELLSSLTKSVSSRLSYKFLQRQMCFLRPVEYFNLNIQRIQCSYIKLCLIEIRIFSCVESRGKVIWPKNFHIQNISDRTCPCPWRKLWRSWKQIFTLGCYHSFLYSYGCLLLKSII